MKLRKTHRHHFFSAVVSAVLLMPAFAIASPPDPGLSSVPRCLTLSPSGALAYRVTIIGSTGPIVSSTIEIRMTTSGDTLICWCNTVGPRPRSFFQTTNGAGVATFNLTGGGCIQYGLSSIPGTLKFAAEVFADAVKMQECGTVSPDAVDSAGRLPTDIGGWGIPGWNPNGICASSLADASQHTTPLSTAVYEWCTDINCDLSVGLADATIITPFLSGAVSCPGDAGP